MLLHPDVVRTLAWWYWLASVLLLSWGILGDARGFDAVIALSLLQVLHFLIRKRSLRAMPVQVRLAFLAVVLAVRPAPLQLLSVLPLWGTTALLLVDYCLLARILSLMPWNRATPLTWALVRRTLLTPPRAAGSASSARAGEHPSSLARLSSCVERAPSLQGSAMAVTYTSRRDG